MLPPGLTVLERGWLSSNNIVLHGAPGFVRSPDAQTLEIRVLDTGLGLNRMAAILQGVDGQRLLHGTSRVIRRALALPSRTVIRATVTGRLKRRGPALPGLRRSNAPSASIFGTCVCPVMMMSGRKDASATGRCP